LRAADTAPTQPIHRHAPASQNRHIRGTEYEYPKWVTTRHRIMVVITVSLITAVLYAVQHLLWPHSPDPHGWLPETWGWLSVLWALPFIPAAFELTGLLLWRAPRAPVRPIPNLVCWRIVSRGINKEALRETITACRLGMDGVPLFPYVIEVLLDHDTALEELPREMPDLHYICVPPGYHTPNGTRNKARALNYALETSPLPREAWIVHLDEETHPTASGIRGIAAAIREEEASGRLRIGQGTITYHRDWENHPFLTLADAIRTGSDLGRLYTAMKMGAPIFGMHGSFIVVRNDIEQSMGFDVGPVGSLTEDAWWGTLAMDAGYRCRWVEGHLAEQCTHSVRDFMKQRRRWFNGMHRTSWRAPAQLRWRLTLMLAMLTWALTPLAWAYTVAHFVDGGYTPPIIRALANAGLAVYITTTLVGLRVNLDDHRVRNRLQRLRWTLTWLVCLPLFSILEAAAVAFAMLRPTRTFHVVKK
jgi:beta-1,4-mannosyltransferase